MYKRILVPVDGSDASNRALEEAISLAREQSGKLCVLHVVDEFILDYTYSSQPFATNLTTSLQQAGQAILDHAREVASNHGLAAYCLLLEAIGARIPELILAQAEAWAADLIVMGTHGRGGLARFVMGSNAEAVVRGAAIPVLVLRGAASQ